MKRKYKMLLFLISIAIIFSAILAFSKIPAICNLNDGCEVVQTSPYATSFGIKNSLLGMIAFIIIGTITYSHIKHPRNHKRRAIQLGIIVGSMIALYFIYLQFFVINAICKYCMVVDIATLLSFLVLILWKEK